MKIIAVNFTWAMDDGLWIEREDGSTTWVHGSALVREVGPVEFQRLWTIAHARGMTGMWYSATTGQNCYANGHRVA